jgi:hypothetical protein
MKKGTKYVIMNISDDEDGEDELAYSTFDWCR